MKKVIISISLTVVSLMTAIVSFLANDVGTYKNWMQLCRPQIMESFGHKDKKGPPVWEDRRGSVKDEKAHHDKDEKPHREMKGQDAPAPQENNQ